VLQNIAAKELVPFLRSMESSPDAAFVTDRRNRIVFWNDAARCLLGYTSDEAVGTFCNQLLKGGDLSGNRYCCENCPIMQIAGRGETVRQFPLWLSNQEEDRVTTEINVLQLCDDRGDYYLVHIVRSVGLSETRAAAAEAASTAPRPQLTLVSESGDVRARKLTGREVEVLGMLAAGRSTPEIGDRLHISQLTVRSHIQNVLAKLEVHSKAEAVAFAFQKNLV
jgi:DNA-binding CsgD family transcriptional regulator